MADYAQQTRQSAFRETAFGQRENQYDGGDEQAHLSLRPDREPQAPPALCAALYLSRARGGPGGRGAAGGGSKRSGKS